MTGDATVHPTVGRPGRGRLVALLVAVGAALARRPALWAVAGRQAWRLVPSRWWARPPFLPLPDRGYLRFRLHTAYGPRGAPTAHDVVEYLVWCREVGRAA